MLKVSSLGFYLARNSWLLTKIPNKVINIPSLIELIYRAIKNSRHQPRAIASLGTEQDNNATFFSPILRWNREKIRAVETQFFKPDSGYEGAARLANKTDDEESCVP
jgi:hypothetical protein